MVRAPPSGLVAKLELVVVGDTGHAEVEVVAAARARPSATRPRSHRRPTLHADSEGHQNSRPEQRGLTTTAR